MLQIYIKYIYNIKNATLYFENPTTFGKVPTRKMSFWVSVGWEGGRGRG